MSRLIKFRAWDNENKCYHMPIYNASEGQLEELLINHNGRLAMWTVSGLIDESKFDGRFILEQFTGLLDKNGKEIFEGDVCRILYTDWPSSTNQELSMDEYFKQISSLGNVEYHAPSFYIMLEDRYGDNSANSLDYGKHGFIEVIGNIHENNTFGK